MNKKPLIIAAIAALTLTNNAKFQTKTLPKNDFSSYEFTGFDGITSLSIAFTGRKELAIDNINLTQYIAPVPEPEKYAMLLAGLGLLAFSASRKLSNN